MLLGGISTLSDRTFTSDAVMHADVGTLLGRVPNKYHGWQILRTCAFDADMDMTMSFDVDADCTIVIVHGTNLDEDTYRPAWLTSGNGYTKQGETGLISGFPEIYTDSGTIDVNSYFYEKSITSASGHSWDGWFANDWKAPYAHITPCILIPPGITVSNVSVPYYEILDNSISDAYTAPAMDEYYWNNNPTSTPSASPTTTVTTLAALVTAVEAASAGDVIQLQDGTYTDEGLFTINSGATGTKGNLITVEPQTAGGVIFDGTTRFRFTNSAVKYLCWQMFKHTGNPYDGDNFDRCYLIDSSAGGTPSFMFFRNIKFDNVGSTSYRSNIFKPDDAKNIVISNCDILNHKGDHTITDGVAADQHLWVRDCDFDGKDIKTGGNQGSFWEMGNGNNATESKTESAQLAFRNRFASFNPTSGTETELISAKASQMRIIGNWFQDNNTGYCSLRTPYFLGVVANIFTNSLGASGTNNCFGRQQGGDVAVSYTHRSINFFSQINGSFGNQGGAYHIASRNNTASNWSPRYDVISGDLSYNGKNPIFLTVDADSSATLPQDVFFEGLAAESDEAAFVQKDSNGAPFGWDEITGLDGNSSVIDGTGTYELTTGVTDASPGFTIRSVGDTIYTPTHGDWAVTINIHPPYWLKKTLPTTIGANW